MAGKAMIQDAYLAVTAKIPKTVTLIAVSKTQSADAIEALYKLGHRDFGENYAQELIEKAEILSSRGCSEIRWHFIGHLQSNKVKIVLPYLHAVHSIDSLKIASELSKRWADSGRSGKLACFVEVNIDDEPTKAGAKPSETVALAKEIASLPGLELRGLMAIPSITASRSAFARLRELETKCRPATRGELSMGMSADFELAIAEGATHVRVGTALFGERKKP